MFRELIGMSSVFQHIGLLDQADGKTRACPKPKVVVFASGKRFVKAADALEKLFPHHDARWAYNGQGQTRFKNKAAQFFMFFHRIDARSVPDPNFLGLTD